MGVDSHQRPVTHAAPITAADSRPTIRTREREPTEIPVEELPPLAMASCHSCEYSELLGTWNWKSIGLNSSRRWLREEAVRGRGS